MKFISFVRRDGIRLFKSRYPGLLRSALMIDMEMLRLLRFGFQK